MEYCPDRQLTPPDDEDGTIYKCINCGMYQTDFGEYEAEYGEAYDVAIMSCEFCR